MDASEETSPADYKQKHCGRPQMTPGDCGDAGADLVHCGRCGVGGGQPVLQWEMNTPHAGAIPCRPAKRPAPVLDEDGPMRVGAPPDRKRCGAFRARHCPQQVLET